MKVQIQTKFGIDEYDDSVQFVSGQGCFGGFIRVQTSVEGEEPQILAYFNPDHVISVIRKDKP